ncbi:3-oxoacyl-ACP synthase III [Limnoglobus roseus]|uniref:3-oxoacyl-ACP synthase III n=1 Tax=Limnoglobus roseus TaxID=2598579 RepID=A0A5C1A796_9BACT|nr:3-oxoacyl-ACP synthase III [Limnoglobus roseus]QEL14305.1 3-oxoacyl-ACP synthase III [Limnoglobus roseus]
MRYSRVHIESIGYELPPVVVSTAELESRLKPFYDEHRMASGQLELLTGISERRWWDRNHLVSDGATAAAFKALSRANFSPKDLDVLIYAGVCREGFEPATACAVASNIGLNNDAAIFDLSNACLGVLNGVAEVANRIELGQAEAGLVVSCETAREINENVIDRLVDTKSMDFYRSSVATLTGGSGAVAVLVTSKDISAEKRRRLVGGMTKNAPQHHNLCRWGLQSAFPPPIERLLGGDLSHTVQRYLGSNAGAIVQKGIDLGMRHVMMPFMETHAGEVLKYGIDLGYRTWSSFLTKFGWTSQEMDKVICHQVGAGHRDAMLKAFGIPIEKDFSTFPYLGNIGTVSLPLTAALAEEREFLQPGHRVGWLGIGSGLNCMMLGIEW